jgi:hypothetical protein
MSDRRNWLGPEPVFETVIDIATVFPDEHWVHEVGPRAARALAHVRDGQIYEVWVRPRSQKGD